MNYEDKKIVAILATNVDVSTAFNVIGHLSIAIGKFSGQEIMGEPILLDKSTIQHLGISRFPFIVTKVKSGKLKNAIAMAKENPNLLVADYPKDMLETRTDEELITSIKAKENEKLEYLGYGRWNKRKGEIMKNNYLILHGSFGNPFVNWFPWLRKEIENRDLECYTPDFPIGVGRQNYKNWSKLLKCYVEAGILNENTIIFAHSIAPIFICKFLVENKIKVKRLVFICGFNHYLGIDEEYDAVNESMYFDHLSEVKMYCKDIVCFYTDNDPYVKQKVEEEFANILTENQIVIPGGGHLNSESGYEEFKELLNYL